VGGLNGGVALEYPPANLGLGPEFVFRYIKRSVAQPGRKSVSRIGIISDTHGLLRPEAERRLAGVTHIIHAGDIGRPEILTALRRIAPVTAIRGNVDKGDWAADHADTELVRLEDRSFYILHDLQDLKINPAARGIDVVISGHSHRARIDTIDGVLYVNPGSAGPRRFRLPITLAILDITPHGLRTEIHDLGA
jgi:putative phosphoesterase